MRTYILVGLIALTGCGTTHTQSTLKNDKGELRYCYLANDHTLVSMGAMSEYNKCLNDAGAAGFKRIDE